MTTAQRRPLERKWKQRLELSHRHAPELFESAEEVRDTPHAGAIRRTLENLGVSAVFCVQGTPTVVILSLDDYDRQAIVDLHGALWNQGLASLLLVLSGDTVRAFSLAHLPQAGDDQDFERRCLVDELDAVAHALELKGIIYGAESGRLWTQHASHFDPKERIDQVLLNNLTESHQLLCKTGLPSDAVQALLIQAMFIAYLEDREIITPEYFMSASGNELQSFSELLESGNTEYLYHLFETLRKDFNGDLFFAPCSFESDGPRPRVTRSHLENLALFRSGHIEMVGTGGQFRFWGYDFKYIPIELISAVYDRFLGEREAERRQQGAYYTPMFLADTVISQVWDSLPLTTKDKGIFLDPACGSGVFLVRSFQRLCEHWRETRESLTIRWDSLCNILSRLHGRDLNASAVRIAVFSLYIALLEERSPPEIRLLVKDGKILPELWGHSLCHQDFFDVSPDDVQADVVIGNPPWTSRKGPDRSSVKWCEVENLPMPGKEDAWAFVWKSLRHLQDGGIVAFLLPAMGFLHNYAGSTVAARNSLIRVARIWRIINFSDLRFQLFDGAVRPAALIVFGRSSTQSLDYRFDYWVPKADLNLKVKRLITLSTADRSTIVSQEISKDPLVFKRRLWMSNPESKLFNYLSAFSKLGDLISAYGKHRHTSRVSEDKWLVGQGFQPFNADLSDSQDKPVLTSEFVGVLPYLPIERFQILAQPTNDLVLWHTSRVRRKGFERGFFGARILIPRGVHTSLMRLRATYLEVPLTFQDIVQAVAVPHGEERRAKVLTALLNSRLLLWFAFHGTSSFGSDRPEVKQAELLRLPFPSPDDMPDPKRSRRAETALVSRIEAALHAATDPLQLQSDDFDVFEALDCLSYEYFCLSDEEITLVEDSVGKIIPAVQPSRGSFPDIWKPADSDDRHAYATTLVRGMADWFDANCSVRVRLEARNSDLAVLRLTLEEGRKHAKYVEANDRSVGEVLSRIFKNIHEPLPGNFQLIPDFRIFSDKYLYLVKPIQRRFWLKSTALADADAIALDLQDAAGFHRRQSGF